MVEQQLLVQHLNIPSTQRAADWLSRYCCFESSCRPADHFEEMNVSFSTTPSPPCVIDTRTWVTLPLFLVNARSSGRRLLSLHLPSGGHRLDYTQVVWHPGLEDSHEGHITKRVAALSHCEYLTARVPFLSHHPQSSYRSTLAWSSSSCTKTGTWKRFSICRGPTTASQKVESLTKSPSVTSRYLRHPQSCTS
jgi:hypothetical protein